MELACNKLASSGVGTCSPTLDASRSLNNIPDWPGFSRTRAERTKCSVVGMNSEKKLRYLP